MKTIITDHARQRAKDRRVSLIHVRKKLRKLPFNEGIHKVYFDDSTVYVTYRDEYSVRIIVTVGKDGLE